ncbi:hypothetical protein GCM10017744_003540 [Streptomyces antimycoticus]|uniref:Uncharacterized protein n=1 Tax=Streptomyces antimycoticus TaxID=68175 RepID=A0A4D4KSA5_9ACTN|nr:hypothetical protein SANT12839_096110 [Streptomyces antimycoticus]
MSDSPSNEKQGIQQLQDRGVPRRWALRAVKVIVPAVVTLLAREVANSLFR